MDLDDRIDNLDTNLFAPIPSQTVYDDKQSLLLLQSITRNIGHYVCLEIGSHL
jgi:hypothetical protein